MPRNYEVALEPGEKGLFNGRLDFPMLSITGEDRQAVMWIGDAGCVGTLSGAALYRLAIEILSRVNPPQFRKAKKKKRPEARHAR